MSNRNKAAGTRWESAVRDYLNAALGLVDTGGRLRDPRDPANVRRQVQTGRDDEGDLAAWPFVLECKNERAIGLADYIRQAEREANTAGARFGAAVVKARGKNTAAGYVVLSLATFARVLEAIRANGSCHPER